MATAVNGTPVLPPLRPKQPLAARGQVMPPRGLPHVSHRPHVGTAGAQRSPTARLIETLLYLWTVMAIVFGLLLASLVLFLLYFKRGGTFTPTLPFSLAAYGSVAITLASGCGLYGLLYHKTLVTAGRRNYALGTFIALGATGAIVVVIGGAMALSLVPVVMQAQDADFSNDRVIGLETHVITKVHALVVKSTSTWQRTQSELKCCGYDQVRVLRGYLSADSAWDTALETAVDQVNAVGGTFCSTRWEECERRTSDVHCPVSSQTWCRSRLLRVARVNYMLLGTCSITLGAAQVLCSVLGLFTLLCDVRRLSGLSPTYRMAHLPLSPIQSADITREVGVEEINLN